MFSGLRRMWRKKEYGRVYSASKKVKQRHRINQREKMINGIKKMEKDAEAGMAYSSGICLEDDQEENDDNCEESSRKKARTINRNNVPVRQVVGRRRKVVNVEDVIIGGSRP
jgi:hypothetical protein